MENVNAERKHWTDEEQACEDDYVANTSTNTTGRIMVKLPFKESPYRLGNSYALALKRFKCLETRLDRDRNLKNQYIKFIEEYVQLGHMTLVQNPSFQELHYVIPHQCVIKLNSTTTKLRVVFDASANTSSGTSLNDILRVGPTIQTELYKQLLRFRLFKYVLTGDIVKMYRMILIDPEHRKFQRILWRDEKSKAIQVYELNTVTYGMSASPFLAIRSLKYLADNYECEFPAAANVLRNHFYVDDMLTGSDNIHKLKHIKSEITSLLTKGGMELAKIQSNVPSLRNDESGVKNMNLDEHLITNALGITWDPVSDTFLFKYQPKKNYAEITKRSILSLSSSIFDPMGLLSPIIVKPRVLLQDLWIMKIPWDTEVPSKSRENFKNFIDDLNNLNLIKISRYAMGAPTTNIQLHGFCDASIRAYGCCIYVRVCDEQGNVFVNLLTAKVRVAPVKKRTLPQLELCGAHLLAQLYKKIIPLFTDVALETFLWTDSTVVLNWLQLHSSTLVTFVGNRISDIQEVTTNCYWRHVPTAVNPADIVSRGSSVGELVQSNWFSGPEFLKKTIADWPPTPIQPLNAESKIAVRKIVMTVKIDNNAIIDLIERVSTYTKILRIIIVMYRWYKRIKGEKITTEIGITTHELENALYIIIWNIQTKYFESEINCLTNKIEIKNHLRSLSLFLDNINGLQLIRVGGRLANADIPEDRKHPFLLPRQCQFVVTLARHTHNVNYHAGPKALMAFLRQRFWIVNCRILARNIVSNCIHCTKYKPKLLTQVMGDLPAGRVTPARPFQRCGVDFCGPIKTYLKIRGKSPYKCYVAVFVCFTTKAVHVEPVSDLSSNAFIAALKRLIGRRGLPTDIFCDNATNFVGANSQLAEFKKAFNTKHYQTDIIHFCSIKLITFHFIPPRAPHFGGIWEAAVKSAKGHLYRTLADAKLTYEELATALIEIEAIMNSRPISPASSDPNDCEALTPGHFLIGAPLNGLVEPTVHVQNISHLERWKRITAIKQLFWRKWSIEYVNELMQRTRWSKESTNLQPGSLVLIHDDNLPPLAWVTGRVEKLIQGADGKVRVADIRTTKGLFRRSIHKLAILVDA